MKKVYSIASVIDMFKILADNEYSLLWDLVDDFEFNGHKISVKRSNQFKSVLIDGRYEQIGGNTKIGYKGETYEPIEWVEKILMEPVKESFEIKNGTIKEIREKIAERSVNEAQDPVIRIFPKGSDGYAKLDAAAKLLTLYKGIPFEVGDTYFDYGQDWRWTTILQGTKPHMVQILTPRNQREILDSTGPVELGKAVEQILKKW